MSESAVFKICSCRDERGLKLRNRCPQLRRGGGAWNANHGTWGYHSNYPSRTVRRAGNSATFAKPSGADMKDIQGLLGHSSISISSDTYTSVVHELETERAKAEAAAAVVPRNRKAS